MSNPLLDLCLLTNDDGPSALLRVTIETVRPLVRDLVVVVPRQDQMAVSSAITLGKPIGVSFDRSVGAWLVDGFPADGVRYALHRLLPRRPSALISGINKGYNLGRCIINSGTVGAAMEAARYGISALCLSADNTMESVSSLWKAGVRELIQNCLQIIAEANIGPFILNVNLPSEVMRRELGAVLLPVSLLEYDESYEEEEIDGKREILRWGKILIEDEAVPDLKILRGGKAVVNLLTTPWTRADEGLKSLLQSRFSVA